MADEARVSQVPVETIIQDTEPVARLSQLPVEVLRQRSTFVPQIYRRV